MQKFTRHQGVAAPLLRDNIDTDAIIPSREMKAVSKHGLAEGMFAGWRYLGAGGRELNPEFVLNQEAYRGTSILLGGANFGCGSSREHAVWALKEYGIRAIIAPGFGSIFFGNCINNGLLPLVLEAAKVLQLAQLVEQDPQQSQPLIDLETLQLSLGEFSCEFSLEEGAREMLLQGLDPIDATLLKSAAIDAFEERDRQQRPWAYL